ncbi:hypothetical protein P343_14780 [Sporolactobacillus laevolacticus DSM 442]|uniref:Uncharacterized protein n=1 Tax=Sporolactobacillus laevolacticus DSM 442 TaxID=1395513 RepID=V6IWI4_9BACL|nr:hypothetical protein P343_14780 [Sporolactobacillus laevolacticus DSM 442]
MIKFDSNFFPDFLNILYYWSLLEKEDKKYQEDQGSAVLSTGAYENNT